MEGKTCTKCGEWKLISGFRVRSGRIGQWESRCLVCALEYKREYRAKNRERHKNQEKARYAANPEPRREAHNAWKIKNPERMAEAKRRCRSTPKGRVEANIRGYIHKTITKGYKSAPTFKALGYTSAELMAHLEKNFLLGMTWENYGAWHIDHKIPLSLFNYHSTDDFDFKIAWSLKNLQPLWAVDNLKKSAKYVGAFQPSFAFFQAANDNDPPPKKDVA